MVDNGQVQHEAYLYLKNGACNVLTIGFTWHDNQQVYLQKKCTV